MAEPSPPSGPDPAGPDLFDIIAEHPVEPAPASWFDNLRVTLDLSSRAVYSSALDDWSYLQFIGIDLNNTFTGPNGDWGTLTLQGYLTRVDNLVPTPAAFDDADDWEFIYRIFNFNYTGLAGGRFNIRVGHLEVPFGLEHTVNTNGTLRAYLHPENIGVLNDWGVGVNGMLPKWEYETAVTTGTGNELTLTRGTFTLAGRVGTPQDAPTAVGVSFFHGEVQDGQAPLGFVRRTRIGMDVTQQLGLWSLLGEASIGRDFDTDVLNVLGEVNWITPQEHVLMYGQWRSFFQKIDTWDNANRISLGVRFTPDSHWTLSTEYSNDLNTFAGTASNAVWAFQVRYRF